MQSLRGGTGHGVVSVDGRCLGPFERASLGNGDVSDYSRIRIFCVWIQYGGYWRLPWGSARCRVVWTPSTTGAQGGQGFTQAPDHVGYLLSIVFRVDKIILKRLVLSDMLLSCRLCLQTDYSIVIPPACAAYSSSIIRQERLCAIASHGYFRHDLNTGSTLAAAVSVTHALLWIRGG